MTARAYAWFETLYVKGAMHALQDSGYRSKGLFATAANMKGNTVTWKIAGKGEATEMSENIEVRPTINAARTTVTSTLKAYEANEDINVTDLTQMSENEIAIAQQSCAMAIGRKFDKIPFQAMDDATSSITTIGDGSAQISPIDLLAGQAAMLAQGITGSPIIHVGVSYNQLASLLRYKEINNADYGGDNPLLRQLGARTWMGMNIIPFPDDTLNTYDTDEKAGYMWFKDCMGFHTPTGPDGKIAMATRIDYIPREKCHHAANTIQAAAKPILFEGIRRLRFLNTAPTAFA
jgi:hypothetical protein